MWVGGKKRRGERSRRRASPKILSKCRGGQGERVHGQVTFPLSCPVSLPPAGAPGTVWTARGAAGMAGSRPREEKKKGAGPR